MFEVPLHVPLDFLNPIFRIRFRYAMPPCAVVPMPEAAVNKDDFLAGRENKIGFSGKVFPVKPETVSEEVNQRPDLDPSSSKFPQKGHFIANFRGGHTLTS